MIRPKLRPGRSSLLAMAALGCTFVLVAGYGWFHRSTHAADNPGSSSMMLAHNVYFSLKDSTPENRQKLVDACHKYLANHPGTVFYAAGAVSDLDRPVNDRDFDVGLHVIFDSREAHDRYQTAPLHLQFIEENKATWAKVRVFDSDVTKP